MLGKRLFGSSQSKPVSGSDTYAYPDTEVMVAEITQVGLPAKVIVYNDEIHTFDEVIEQLIKATGCSYTEADKYSFEIDAKGLACVYMGEMIDCLSVTSVLEEIALYTSIEV